MVRGGESKNHFVDASAARGPAAHHVINVIIKVIVVNLNVTLFGRSRLNGSSVDTLGVHLTRLLNVSLNIRGITAGVLFFTLRF